VDIAERHAKPLVFVINAATPRARITGESAVALSQHGMVAPVIIHHRVDYAASMIDGRTVGEAAPNSASAREVHDLWLYLQDKLSRAVNDPRLTPDFKPDFAVNPLLDVVEDGEEEHEQMASLAPEPPPIITTPTYTGPDRRIFTDRRVAAEIYRGPERRNLAFGRRRGDPAFDTGVFK
jgi:hypothetical protein